MNRRSLLTILAVGLAGMFLSRTSLAKGDFPEGSPHFETDYKAALASAAKAGKPVIVVFSATWCPPCQANKKKVYPSDAVKPYHEKFVWAYLDVDDPANQAASKKYQTAGLPHLEFLNAKGLSVARLLGKKDAKTLAAQLSAVLPKALPAPR